MNELPSTNWLPPTQEPPIAGNRTEQDVADWRDLHPRVAEIARASGWSKVEAARRIDMAEGTFSQWYTGNYAGRLDVQNAKVKRWLESAASAAKVESAIPDAPAFVRTRTAQEILQTLELARVAPDMVTITLAAGMGKTHTGKHYCAITPHAFRVVMRPQTKTCYAMLVELARALQVNEPNPARLDSAIGARLQRNGRQTLLIVDEAQHLEDRAVDQLRFFLDEYGCGIALTGNMSINGRFNGEKRNDDAHAQLRRRIGKRLHRAQPYQEDITAFIDAWGVVDDDQRRLLAGIGRKAGHLGTIDKTLRLAWLNAAGAGEPLSLRHIEQAYRNREWED